jgi:hypothetical protein
VLVRRKSLRTLRLGHVVLVGCALYLCAPNIGCWCAENHCAPYDYGWIASRVGWRAKAKWSSLLSNCLHRTDHQPTNSLPGENATKNKDPRGFNPLDKGSSHLQAHLGWFQRRCGNPGGLSAISYQLWAITYQLSPITNNSPFPPFSRADSQ